MLLLVLVTKLQAKEIAVFPPAHYIGIYNEYHGYKNGNLPYTGKPYTGPWKSTSTSVFGGSIMGFYKDGFPVGVWSQKYGSGIVLYQYAYNKDTYSANIYFPDGMLRSSTYGKIVHKDNFIEHIAFGTSNWDFYGKELLPIQEHSKSISGWQWGPIVMLCKQKATTINDIIIDVYGIQIDSNSCDFAVYFYSKYTYLGKHLSKWNLNHSDGSLKLLEEKTQGNLGNIKIKMKPQTIITENDAQTGININISALQKATDISIMFQIKQESMMTDRK